MTRSEQPSFPTVEPARELAEGLRAAEGLVLGLDFDGTLAPIVTDPDAARLDPAVRDPIERLVARDNVSVAVVSGRALGDLAERVPVDDVVLAGNHGLEVQRGDDRTVVPAAADARDRISRLGDHLENRLADVPGCRIEDKGLTLSVHVRETPEDRVEDVRSVVESLTVALDETRLVDGKAVYEIRPTIDHDKGAAMTDCLATVPDDWLGLFVGDDTTDEDAFRALQSNGGFGVRVGDEAATAATYSLPGQSAVSPFLSWLRTELSAEPR